MVNFNFFDNFTLFLIKQKIFFVSSCNTSCRNQGQRRIYIKRMSPWKLKEAIWICLAFLDYQFKNFEFMSKVGPNNAKLVLKQLKKKIIEFYKRRKEKPVNINEVALTA